MNRNIMIETKRICFYFDGNLKRNDCQCQVENAIEIAYKSNNYRNFLIVSVDISMRSVV